MIVMKFGGTSVEDAPSIQRVMEIIKERLELRPVVVVSAMGKTTRKLLDAAERAAAGEQPACVDIVGELKSVHEAKALALFGREREAFGFIETYFDELSKLLEGLAILGEVPPRGLDKILSYGELLSSAILASALQEAAVPARLLDARQFIKTDDRYGRANPIVELTNESTRQTIGPVLGRGEVPVVQGFIGSTREGATTTLGFEGSDYTASLIGAALGADDIQIWKDVSGLMTADPKVLGTARTVRLCSFAEAAELTFFGAKVLHPKAIHPAARAGIKVHIYNSKRPTDVGTEIRADIPRCANAIKSIAYKRPVTIIGVSPDPAKHDSHEVSSNEFLRSLLLILNRRRINPLLAGISGSNVTIAIETQAIAHGEARDLIDEISTLGSATAETGRALVSIVGEEMRNYTDLATSLFAALGSTRLPIIVRGSSPIALSVVVQDEDVFRVIASLHDAFFKHLDPAIFA